MTKNSNKKEAIMGRFFVGLCISLAFFTLCLVHFLLGLEFSEFWKFVIAFPLGMGWLLMGFSILQAKWYGII